MTPEGSQGTQRGADHEQLNFDDTSAKLALLRALINAKFIITYAHTVIPMVSNRFRKDL